MKFANFKESHKWRSTASEGGLESHELVNLNNCIDRSTASEGGLESHELVNLNNCIDRGVPLARVVRRATGLRTSKNCIGREVPLAKVA